MPIRLVIFDCDGVLFDSEPANLAFYREVLRLADAPPMPESVEAAYHSLASTQLFEKIFGDQPEMLARVKAIAKSTPYAPFFEFMGPKPLLRETLSLLRQRYRIAMATNRGQTTQGVIDHFELRPFFDVAVGVLDVANPKPYPDMLLLCLERVGVAAGEAIYVGDQSTDLEAARAAGIEFIGMGPMCGRTPHSAQRFEEIPGLIEKVSR
jgi:HAD superfamily hydrolase (TIGR01509 family)